jgi:hypothetical protein
VTTARHGCVKESLFRNEAGGYGVRRSSELICNLHALVLKTGLPNRTFVEDEVAYNSGAGDLAARWNRLYSSSLKSSGYRFNLHREARHVGPGENSSQGL